MQKGISPKINDILGLKVYIFYNCEMNIKTIHYTNFLKILFLIFNKNNVFYYIKNIVIRLSKSEHLLDISSCSP